MKTAMQEFIESLRSIGVTVHNTDIFLEKEKEQIKSAYNAGYDEAINEEVVAYDDAVDYYTQTYTNQTLKQ